MSSFLNKLACGTTRTSSPPVGRKRSLSLKRKSSQLKSAGSNRNVYKPSAPPIAEQQNNQQQSNNLPDLTKQLSMNENDYESFWDIGNYKFALKRCDNGHKLGTELADMISERAKLEENYAKSIKNWHKKWTTHLNGETTEYETTRLAWQSFLDAGNQTSEIHLDLCKSLINNPVSKIQNWLKRKYEKNFFSFKQTKEFENDFVIAAKPWVEQIEKLKKFKREYYESIRATKAAEEAALAGQSNPKLTQEQKEKLDEKANKSREDQDRALRRYKDQLVQIDLYKPKHIEKMTEVFEKTENFEHDRMMFFKQTFLECYDLLQIQNDERHQEIFNEYGSYVNKMNPKSDLEWWSRMFGPDTKANWPVFEEYQGQH